MTPYELRWGRSSSAASQRARRPGRSRFRPGLDLLEGRTLLSLLPSTTAVAASASTTIYGQAVTLTATVASSPPGNGTPTGTVTFYDGGTTLGTASLSGGKAAITKPLTTLGENVITASYSGDAEFAAGATGTISTIAGTGVKGFSGDYGPGTKAQLNAPDALAFNQYGDLLIADSGNDVVRYFDMSNDQVNTYWYGYYRDLFGNLSGIVSYNSSDLYVSSPLDEFVTDLPGNGAPYTTAAGDGTKGFGGDGGPAPQAQLDHPSGLATGPGGIFIADTGNNRIRAFSPGGAIKTVAGNGKAGYSGDGGPATQARLNAPEGVAVDDAGDVFIADTGNHRVREVIKATGKIITVAGDGTAGHGGDGGPAPQAQLDHPSGLAVDSSGNLFIADAGNDKIRELVAATGRIVTVAGTATLGLIGDGGLATSTLLNDPVGVVLDSSGHLFIAEEAANRVRQVTPAARVEVVPDPTATFLTASTGAVLYGQPVTLTATVANASPVAGTPTGTVTFLNGGTVLGLAALSGGTASITVPTMTLGDRTIAASYSGDATFAPSSTGQIVTVAGSGAIGNGGDGGPAGAASFESPSDVVIDHDGNLYIADFDRGVVREVVKATGKIITIAGNGKGGDAGDGGPATQAELSSPSGLAIDDAGDLFIAEANGAAVREVIKATGVIITVAGDHKQGYSGDGGPATQARLVTPEAVALDSNGNLYIADSGNHRVREVIKATGTIVTVAGDGTYGYGGDGGLATKAQIGEPSGLAVDSDGNLFIADSSDNVVRKVVKASGRIFTIAGDGIAGYSGDGGPPTKARLNRPAGLGIDAAGDLFIADVSNGVIREVIAHSGPIVTVAGDGTRGYSGDGGPATQAELNLPGGVAVDAAGDLFIADGENARIRLVTAAARIEVLTVSTSMSLASSSGSVPFGQGVTFVAKLSANGPGPVHPGGPIVFTIDGTRTVDVPLDATGQAVLSVANLGPGHHTVTAAYAGGVGFLPSESLSIAQDIVRADPRAQVVIIAIRNRRGKVIGLRLTASLAGAAGVRPTGPVNFQVKKRTLATLALGDGTAALTIKPKQVLKKTITVRYGGDANFLPGTVTTQIQVPR